MLMYKYNLLKWAIWEDTSQDVYYAVCSKIINMYMYICMVITCGTTLKSAEFRYRIGKY